MFTETTESRAKRVTAQSRALDDIRQCNCLSVSREVAARANSTSSPNGTRMPVKPSRTASSTPVTRQDTTGTPDACASKAT